MATVDRRLIAALVVWCSFTSVAHADDGADVHASMRAVQLAQTEGCPANGTTAVVL
jgi:hypothetical protein